MAQGSTNISHLPVQQGPAQSTTLPGKAGGAAQIVTVPSKTAALQINGRSINIDVTEHTPQNIMDLINGANINGVSATLDRHGSLVIKGEQAIGGDATLRALLGV